MELIILFIIIMIILSSLSRYFKGEGEKSGHFSPSRPDSSLRDLIEKFRESTDIEEEEPVRSRDIRFAGKEQRREPAQAEEHGAGEQLSKKEKIQAPARGSAGKRKRAPSTAQETAAASPGARSEARATRGRKDPYETVKKTGELERDLEELLKGKKLPLSLVASEVLGPPRSKKPYGWKR